MGLLIFALPSPPLFKYDTLNFFIFVALRVYSTVYRTSLFIERVCKMIMYKVEGERVVNFEIEVYEM